MNELSEHEYDLVVVGAGPAGSSAAYAAAKNGIKVALLEKEESVAQTDFWQNRQKRTERRFS